MKSALIPGLIGLQVFTVAGETKDRYEPVDVPVVTFAAPLHMPVMPHGHESTYGTTQIAPTWEIARVTSTAWIAARNFGFPLILPRGLQNP